MYDSNSKDTPQPPNPLLRKISDQIRKGTISETANMESVCTHSYTISVSDVEYTRHDSKNALHNQRNIDAYPLNGGSESLRS